VFQERLFIGTPGSYYWQGQTYSQNLWNRLDLVATEEGPESEDNTYLGYALALGHFDADGHPDLAVGMPRGANLTGKVIFLTGRTMGQLHNLTGSQVKWLSLKVIRNIRETYLKGYIREISKTRHFAFQNLRDKSNKCIK